MCVCVRTLFMCVAVDQRQLGRGGGGKWYLVPPPTSPPLCICPLQFEQCGVFFSPASLFFFSPTHSLIQSERGKKRKRKNKRERLLAREPSYSATVELIRLMHTAAGTVLCVHVCVRDRVSRAGESGFVI